LPLFAVVFCPPMQSQSSTKNTSPCHLRHCFDSSTRHWFLYTLPKAREQEIARCSPHSYSESKFHFVIRMKAKIKSHCWTGLARKSWPKIIADLHRFLLTLFAAWTLYTEHFCLYHILLAARLELSSFFKERLWRKQFRK
jgi:hypothetical protein